MNKFIKFGKGKIPTTNIHIVESVRDVITVRYYNGDKIEARYENPTQQKTIYKKLLNYRKNIK